MRSTTCSFPESAGAMTEAARYRSLERGMMRWCWNGGMEMTLTLDRDQFHISTKMFADEALVW